MLESIENEIYEIANTFLVRISLSSSRTLLSLSKSIVVSLLALLLYSLKQLVRSFHSSIIMPIVDQFGGNED